MASMLNQLPNAFKDVFEETLISEDGNFAQSVDKLLS